MAGAEKPLEPEGRAAGRGWRGLAEAGEGKPPLFILPPGPHTNLHTWVTVIIVIDNSLHQNNDISLQGYYH